MGEAALTREEIRALEALREFLAGHDGIEGMYANRLEGGALPETLATDLCDRGLLRAEWMEPHPDHTEFEYGGWGYSLTQAGEQALARAGAGHG